jgi:hypothetical protein
MRRGFALLAILLFAAGSALAVSPGPSLYMQAPRPGEALDDLAAPQLAPSRQDTAWFGGDNGSGIAYLNGMWDFETPGSNGFQGCRSFDQTVNPATYFYRVTASDFTSHGDPCTPMILGTPGEIWCGIHQDEADQRDFIAGMGYQNQMCQRAFSPMYTSFSPATQAIDLAFTYFNHSEPGFDYSYVYVLCYDASSEVIEEYLVTKFDGVIGDYQVPAFYDEGVEVPAGTLPAATTKVQLEMRFVADGGWSDEDGSWDTPCGPFAADDVAITVGTSNYSYNFNTGADGWTFNKCEGKGAWMHIVHDYEYQEWLDDLGLTCGCTLVGDAVAFVNTLCANGPGLVPGQNELFETGPVPRTGYPAPFWNAVVVEHDHFLNLPHESGAHYRPGWRKYPYTTEVNPVPHWSKRQGQDVWYYASPGCGLDRDNLSTMANAPLPVAWDSVRYTYEVYCSCDGFTIPPSSCIDEGCTGGAPVIDNFRIGLTNAADAPPITLMDGGLFIDGFGQNYPTYLEPSDRCNANVSYDVSMDNTAQNDYNGDSSVVAGPVVGSEAARFLCQMCFKVARLGARQNMIPEYHAWKARLASDPEDDFVCVLMDSLETANHTQVWKNKFWTYFHEDAQGFGGSPDYGPQNEILPDQIWVPGTRIEYYFRSYWYNGGVPPTEYYLLGYPPAREMEFLPGMEVRPGEEYTVQWPSMLYVDAYNRGSETYMLPALEQLGIPFDKFDFTDNSSNYNASMKRDLGGTVHNPGGYANNGCTTEQLLGYRLIVWSNGNFGFGSCEPEDFQMFDSWLETTNCGLANIRRGIIFDGDEICKVMADDVHGLAINFCHNVLGTTVLAEAYRDYNEDPDYCVYLEPVAGAQFAIAAPGDALYGNGCPQEFNYNVLGVQAGVQNAVGNLNFYSYQGQGNEQYVSFAQVVRQRQQAGVANWRSAVNGFSFHHLAQRNCSGEPCSSDSACIVGGTSNLYGPMLTWFAQGGTPFTKWIYPCINTGVEPPVSNVGMVNHLYQSRPNPFNTRATIRFSMASQGQVNLAVFDVSGRLVKTLMDGQAQAGENSVVWDGTDSKGNRVGGGVFWVQMTTHDGYTSGKKMLVLR